jgi:hypothetical protein
MFKRTYRRLGSNDGEGKPKIETYGANSTGGPLRALRATWWWWTCDTEVLKAITVKITVYLFVASVLWKIGTIILEEKTASMVQK